MRKTYLHTQWHWRWSNLSWHLFDCERKEAAKKQQSWPPKCHQMPSIWGKWYWTCSIDIRSFSCVCIHAELLCLCGVCMYPKSQEDCFPCVHESWQQQGVAQPVTKRQIPRLGFSQLEELDLHWNHFGGIWTTWTMETSIYTLLVVFFLSMMRKYFMILLPILKDQRLFFKNTHFEQLCSMKTRFRFG